jgi:hypothetical protein
MTTRTRPRLSLKTYGAGLEAFNAELGEAYYRHYAGLSATLEAAPIYEKHARLFSEDAIAGLRALATGSDTRAAEARPLLGLALREHLSAAVAPLTDRVETAAAQAVVVWRGERIPFRAVWNRAIDITSRGARNALADMHAEALEAMNPLYEERFAGISAAVRALGYSNVSDLVAKTGGFDPEAVGAEMRAFLVDSETVYFAALRRYLAEIDIEQGDASLVDLDHVLRGAGWDPWFARGGMIPALRATLRGLGIDLARQSNILLDVELRPMKTPRASCIAVRVPDDIRLIVQPHGGWDDYAALLHEAAHAEHFAHASVDLPVAFRLAGDNSVTEGYAALLERLTGDPLWVAEHVRMSDADARAYADFAAFWYLNVGRRAAAQLLYELTLNRSGNLSLAREQYEGILGLTLGVRYPQAQFLESIDDNLGAARYVRAAMLEGTLAAWLRRRFGDAWWRSPEAGEELRRLWSRGQESNAEALVAQLGYDRLDWRPVLRQIRTRLIGEMSGYGGPNITSRAGTRKV